MISSAMAAAASWNCLLLKSEVSSLLGKLLPLSHSSHFSHSAFSALSASAFSSLAFFLRSCSFSFYSCALTLASCFLRFYSCLASSFFFSWSGNSLLYSFSLQVVSFNIFQVASFSLTSQSPLPRRSLSTFSFQFYSPLIDFLRKSILERMTSRSLISFSLLASSACRLGLFLSWCLSYSFCRICRLSLLTQVLRSLTVSSSLLFSRSYSRCSISVSFCSSTISCLKLRLSLFFSFLASSLLRVSCSLLAAISLLRASISLLAVLCAYSSSLTSFSKVQFLSLGLVDISALILSTRVLVCWFQCLSCSSWANFCLFSASALLLCSALADCFCLICCSSWLSSRSRALSSSYRGETCWRDYTLMWLFLADCSWSISLSRSSRILYSSSISRLS